MKELTFNKDYIVYTYCVLMSKLLNSTPQDHGGGRQDEAPEHHLQAGQQKNHVEEARIQLRELFKLFY